jgi:hypothetical protein
MPGIIEGCSYDIFISYHQKDIKHDSRVAESLDNPKGELKSMFEDEMAPGILCK